MATSHSISEYINSIDLQSSKDILNEIQKFFETLKQYVFINLEQFLNELDASDLSHIEEDEMVFRNGFGHLEASSLCI